MSCAIKLYLFVYDVFIKVFLIFVLLVDIVRTVVCVIGCRNVHNKYIFDRV